MQKVIEPWYEVPVKTQQEIKKLKGPIVIFGAGGFIGFNLFKTLSAYRSDVFAISHNPKDNWRFHFGKADKKQIITCDVLDNYSLEKQIKKIKPQTIFYLAAYGAYPKQKDFSKMYATNVVGLINLIELLKQQKFTNLISIGSSSEYGLNATQPKETDELLPNSHYALSKLSAYFIAKYYGKMELLPVIHTRLYAVYGPWEEPDRLIPKLLENGQRKQYPPLVGPETVRDFIYVGDVNSALISLAANSKKQLYGEVFNIGCGRKVTLLQAAEAIKHLCQIPDNPKFGTMVKRNYDVPDWYATIRKIKKTINWQPIVPFENGLALTLAWQQQYNYQVLINYWQKHV